jgi:hypothetical protein
VSATGESKRLRRLSPATGTMRHQSATDVLYLSLLDKFHANSRSGLFPAARPSFRGRLTLGRSNRDNDHLAAPELALNLRLRPDA